MGATYEPGLQVQLDLERGKVLLVMASETGWIRQGFSPEKAEWIASQLQGAAQAVREGRTLSPQEQHADAEHEAWLQGWGAKYSALASEGRLICPECQTKMEPRQHGATCPRCNYDVQE